MLLCAFEDRAAHEPGVRLLVRSLFAAMPDARLRLYFDPPDDAFLAWAQGYGGLELRPAQLGEGRGWNVKPSVLLAALDDGEQAAVWLDADLIINGDFRAVFRAVAPQSLIVAEEARWGAGGNHGSARTRSWDMPVGRDLPGVLNSCVIRVTPHHRALLEDWRELLRTRDYIAAQAQPWSDRPAHLLGDQDALTALLGSVRHADIPIHILRRGADIIQDFGPFGFTLAERLLVRRRGLPCFLHAQGSKPWLEQPHGEGPLQSLQRAYRDTSPYTLQAMAMEGRAAPAWTRPRTRLGAVLRRAGFGRIWLAGAPLAALFDLGRMARAVKRLFR